MELEYIYESNGVKISSKQELRNLNDGGASQHYSCSMELTRQFNACTIQLVSSTQAELAYIALQGQYAIPEHVDEERDRNAEEVAEQIDGSAMKLIEILDSPKSESVIVDEFRVE